MEQLDIDAMKNLTGELMKESDRAAAILAASFLETQLETLLKKSLTTHKDQDLMFRAFAPLGTFSAKISMAFLIGLIPEDIYKDLSFVKKIRNEFAHNYKNLTFDHPPVKDWVYNLEFIKWFIHAAPLAYKPLSKEVNADIQNRPRKRFEMGIALLMTTLDQYAATAAPFPKRKNESLWNILTTCPECNASFAGVPTYSEEGDKVFITFTCPNKHTFKNLALDRQTLTPEQLNS